MDTQKLSAKKSKSPFQKQKNRSGFIEEDMD